MKHFLVLFFGCAAMTLLAGGIGCSSGTEVGGSGGGSSVTDGSGGNAVDASGSGGLTNMNGMGTGGLETGSTGSGGATNNTGGGATGGNAAGGATGAGGASDGSGTGGAQPMIDCTTEAAAITYPTLPGATQSSTYTVKVNGTTQFVEKMAKFAPEMQVHYAHFGLAAGCTATIAVQVSGGFSNFTLSPKSRNLSAMKNGDTITFDSGPNYLILQVDTKELLFILIDDEEMNPPQVGDANVKSIADYNVDNTGGTLETAKVQSAIDAASGATQDILYFPPGRYKVGELSLKSNMTLYLAAGSILDGSSNTGDYKAAGPAVEDTTHGLVHLNKVSNVNILGRGVIDCNGSVIRGTSNDTPAFKINTLRIDESSKILIDGIVSRDPVFWNTLIFDSDQVTFQNYKVINRRPITTDYNQEDGVDFDCSTNGKLYNGFIYSGDDSMSPKREQEGTLDTKNITYEKVVAYSNSAAMKIGTKTYGTTIDTITFKDIDVVKAGRAMGINADDTAVIKNITWQDIRIETVDGRIVEFEEDATATWRNAPNMATVKDVYITDVSSSVNKEIYIHGHSSSVNIDGVHFNNFTIQGNKATSQSGWNLNSFVSNITFQ